MAGSHTVFSDMLAKLQEVLNGFNCKSESRISDHDALLYGKFSSYMDKYNIVIHITEESHKPVTTGANKVDINEKERDIRITPSLELQTYKGQVANCSEKEQNEIRDNFMKEMEAIGREFVHKWNQRASEV